MMPHAPVIPHPTWCRSTHQDDPAPDHIHDGPKTIVRCSEDDYRLSLHLSRIDEVDTGSTGIVMESVSWSSEAAARPYLTPADARQLAELLVAFADAAELPGVEVAW
jgi:hypothetical protein